MSWNQFNTAYNLFYAHVKNEITQLNPTKTNTEITRLISEKWKILTDNEKAEYEIRAKRDGLEYITDAKKRSELIDEFGSFMRDQILMARRRLNVDCYMMFKPRNSDDVRAGNPNPKTQLMV
jgi:hypothetical protein